MRTVAMCIFRARLEQYAFLCFLSLVSILVVSWVAVERHVDPRTSLEIMQERQRQILEMMRDIQEQKQKFDLEQQQVQTPNEDLRSESIQQIAQDKDYDDNILELNQINKNVSEVKHKPNENSLKYGTVRPPNYFHKLKTDSNSPPNFRDSSTNGYEIPGLNKSIEADTNLTFARIGKRKHLKTSKMNQSGSLGKLRGGEAKVKVYSTKSAVSDEFECVKLNIKPGTLICLHDNVEDVHVSRHLRQGGLWEPHLLRLFQNHLFQNPDIGVYDIGCHVGQYSLLAAVMGHLVVSVDPFLPNLRRLHKGIQLNKVEKKIIVVQNAVSDERETYELVIPKDNRGGVRLSKFDADRFCDDPSCPPHAHTIFIDDLLEVTNFKSAIIKIDIEGHEHIAFKQSAKLFEAVKIHFIFMEWMKLRAYYGSEVDDSLDKRQVFELINTLTERGFSPRGSVLLDELNINYWYGWPDDIIWQHKDAFRA